MNATAPGYTPESGRAADAARVNRLMDSLDDARARLVDAHEQVRSYRADLRAARTEYDRTVTELQEERAHHEATRQQLAEALNGWQDIAESVYDQPDPRCTALRLQAGLT